MAILSLSHFLSHVSFHTVNQVSCAVMCVVSPCGDSSGLHTNVTSNYLCISATVPHCVKIAREAVKNGKASIRNVSVTGRQGHNLVFYFNSG